VVVEALENLVDPLAQIRLDRLGVSGDALDVPILELPGAILEAGESGVAVQCRGHAGLLMESAGGRGSITASCRFRQRPTAAPFETPPGSA
jgi:hypothetical protein